VVERRKACCPRRGSAAPQGAEDDAQRLSAFRFPFCLFGTFICSPDEAQRNPGLAFKASRLIPDFAPLHPGYGPSVIVMKAGATAGWI
jgi:hypothetical protein